MQTKIVNRVSYNEAYSGVNLNPYDGTFTNSSLINGQLTIAHNLNISSVFLSVFSPDGWIEFVKWNPVDNNTIIVDFGGIGSSIQSGTWIYKVWPNIGGIYSDILINEVKNFLKIDFDNTSEDATLARMIKSAIDLIEKMCKVALTETTVEVYYEDYDIDDNEVTVPIYPFSEIVKCEVVDSEGVKSEVQSSRYILKGLNEKSIKVIGSFDNVIITYKCGYGINGKTELTPDIFKEAIIVQVADWYENRTDYVPVMSAKIKRMLNNVNFSTWI